MYGLNQGTKIGAYTLEQQLGAGGQGSVWRARHDGTPGAPPVALKILPVRGSPASMVERIRREAEALIKLSTGHPSVVACHGMLEDETLGVLAVAMELVEGVELGPTLRDPRCDAAAREKILLHVASALGYLHNSGFVHRDVKPQNVLVRHAFWASPDDPSTVKLVDFGIATVVGNPKPLTEVGTVIGTPAYMPPERIDPMFWQGTPGSPTEDVFALGVLSYETFFGRHPANVEDDGTLSVYAERYRAISRAGEAFPQLPPGHRWTAALRGALALKRSERFADCNQVVSAVTGTSSTVRDPSLAGPGQRTEIGAPLPFLAGDPGVGAMTPAPAMPGSTQVGGVHGAPVAATTQPVGGPTPQPWAASPSQPGPWAGPGVPPPPPGYEQRGGGGGGSRSMLIGAAVVVGLFTIGAPIAFFASRMGGSGDSDQPIVVPTTPVASATAVPTTTDTGTPPVIPTPFIPPIGTSTTPQPNPNPNPRPTGTSTGTSKPAPTGTVTIGAPPPKPTGTPTGTTTVSPPPPKPTGTTTPAPTGTIIRIPVGKPGGNTTPVNPGNPGNPTGPGRRR